MQTYAVRPGPGLRPGTRLVGNGGDIQATTKVVDCRSLKSSPPYVLETGILESGVLETPAVLN